MFRRMQNEGIGLKLHWNDGLLHMLERTSGILSASF